MKRRKKWLRLLIPVLVLAALGYGYYTMKQKTSAASYTELQVQTGSIQTYYNFDGIVKARYQQTIRSAVDGKVKKVFVRQNGHVKDGDRLYKLETGEIVKSQMDGEVTALFVEDGCVVSSGMVTAEIIGTDRLEAELNVDEYDVGAVVLGTPVDFTIPATGETLTGTVRALNKNGTTSGDLSYYTAYVTIQQSGTVYPGMQVSAKVLRSAVRDVPVLRVSAVQFDDYNKPYVLVRGNDDAAEQRPIEVGVSDGINCQILSGLTVGDTVLVPSGMSMSELMAQMRNAGK